MNKIYNYPDGTDTDIRPKDGEVCKTASHKRGKDTYYEWDDGSSQWLIVPNYFTDPAIIEKSKEILKIGKFYHKRPPKKYHYNDYSEYDSFDFGNMIGPHRIACGYPSQQNSAFNNPNNFAPDGTPICSVTAQYKSIMGNIAEFRSKKAGETEKPKCECGAHYTRAMNKHYSWCSLYGKDF